MLLQQIGEALKAERLRQGLTQKDAAQRMGRHPHLVQTIEYQNRDLRLSTLELYADALGVRLSVEVSRNS